MRRTTLGPISSSQLNVRSTALAHPSSSRTSLGPGANGAFSRQSIGPLVSSGAATASRRVSTASHGARRPPPPVHQQQTSASSGAPRHSIPRQSIGATSNGGSGRRGSIYNGRTSMSTRGGRVDPRPLADKTYMSGCIHALIEFLSERGYDHVLSPKLLKGPSKKDFCNIIEFLFRQIDPTFEFGVKFEEDVAAQLKNLRYPFAISKTALVAVGSPHTWPALLGSLAWLIELLSYDEIIQRESHNSDDFDSENGDNAFFEYLIAAYTVFLAGNDDAYNVLEQQEVTKHETRNQEINTICDAKAQRADELRKRIERQKNANSSLPELHAKKRDCGSDLDKFKELVTKLESHKTSLIHKIQKRDTFRLDEEKKLQSRQHTIQSLHLRIENQELSSEDLEHMAHERVRLNEQCHVTAQRQEDVHAHIRRQETTIVIQMDTIESHVKAYSIKATDMKLLPSMAKNAHDVNYEVELDAHVGGVVAAQNLSKHLRQHIRPALLNFQKNRSNRRSVALDESLQLAVDVDCSRSLLSNERESKQTLAALAKKLDDSILRDRNAHAQAIAQKQAATEDVVVEIEAIANEQDVHARKAQTQQQLEATKRAYATTLQSFESLVERNRHEVVNALISCTNHKEAIDQAITAHEQVLDGFWSE